MDFALRENQSPPEILLYKLALGGLEDFKTGVPLRVIAKLPINSHTPGMISETPICTVPPMIPSNKWVQEYKKIYYSYYQKDISDQEALDQAINLVRFVQLLYGPETQEKVNKSLRERGLPEM